jgi:hypothetical protein
MHMSSRLHVFDVGLVKVSQCFLKDVRFVLKGIHGSVGNVKHEVSHLVTHDAKRMTGVGFIVFSHPLNVQTKAKMRTMVLRFALGRTVLL